MKIANSVSYLNYNNSNLNFRGRNIINLSKNQTMSPAKSGYKSSLLALAFVFFGGIVALQGLSTGAFESKIKEGKEKVENLMHNIKEQNRIDKLPDGEYKELQQSVFNLKKEIEKGF